MAHSPEELIARWRARPDAASTLAVADGLRRAPDPTTAAEVARHVERSLASDVSVLTAAARMCLANALLPEAQQLLGVGAKLAPRSGILLRLLGEAQLRRGDAERAEKTLERAARVDSDPEIRAWLDRARRCSPLQVREGARAVATHVAEAYPLNAATGSRRPGDDDDRETNVRSARDDRRARAREDDDLDTQVRSARDALRPALEALHARRAATSAAPPPSRSAPPPPLASSRPPPIPSAPPMLPPPRSAPPPTVASAPPPPRSVPPPPVLPPPRAAPPPTVASAPAPPPVLPPRAAPPPPVGSAPPRPLSAPPPTVGSAVPSAAQVFEELAQAGVFEHAGDPAAWAPPPSPPPQKRRALAAAALLFAVLGGAIGAFFYDRDQGARRHAEAEAHLADVDAELATKPGVLDERRALAAAFEREPGSPHAARAWVRARVLAGLTRGSEQAPLVEPLARARRVGVPEHELAYAEVAAALFDDDVLHALELLALWDERAARESDYQLLAGLALAHAGAPDAPRRLLAATRLAPANLVAQLALARYVALAGPPREAEALARAFQVAHPDAPEGSALVALAWAARSHRAEAPPEVAQTLARAAEFPRPLRFVPHALLALEALKSPATHDRARTELNAALALADGPDEACWLAELSLDASPAWGAPLAAQVAARVSAKSPTHPRALRLTARAALVRGHLHEAEVAVRDVARGDALTALIDAVGDYERASAVGLAKHLDALRPAATASAKSAAKSGSAGALVWPAILNAQAILLGTTLPRASELMTLSATPEPWAELLAMDSALDMGDLDTASRIAPRLTGTTSREYAARRARLARYRGDLEVAEAESRLAVGSLVPNAESLRGAPRYDASWRARIERLLVLVARKERGLAIDFVKDAGFGELEPFAVSIARSASGFTGPRELPTTGVPGPESAVVLRLLVARGYGAARDRNAGFTYVQRLVKAGFTNPDVVLAAEGVNLPPVTPRSSPTGGAAP